MRLRTTGVGRPIYSGTEIPRITRAGRIRLRAVDTAIHHQQEVMITRGQADSPVMRPVQNRAATTEVPAMIVVRQDHHPTAGQVPIMSEGVAEAEINLHAIPDEKHFSQADS